MTFHVGDRVRAARDITSVDVGWRDDGKLIIKQGTVGTITEVDPKATENMPYEVQTVYADRHAAHLWVVDGAFVADVPADADVVAQIIAALEAELASVTPAYERAIGDVVWRQYYGGKSDGIALALRIVREIGKVQP